MALLPLFSRLRAPERPARSIGRLRNRNVAPGCPFWAAGHSRFMDYVSRVETYRRHAAECTRAAANPPEPGVKEAYLNLATGWLNLAEQRQLEQDDKPPLQATGE